MKEGLECSVKMNEWVQVDGKGRDMKTSCGNSSLPSQPQQDNPSNQGMLWPLALWGLLGEAVPALPACFVPPWTAAQLSSTKMVQAQWLQGPHICSFSLQKHRGWLGRWNICLWEKWVRYQKVTTEKQLQSFFPITPVLYSNTPLLTKVQLGESNSLYMRRDNRAQQAQECSQVSVQQPLTRYTTITGVRNTTRKARDKDFPGDTPPRFFDRCKSTVF